MVWFNVDDTLSNHPKARAAGLEALGLWVVCGSFCGQYLTDGRVPQWYVESWPKGLKLAQKLVDADLWITVDGGWVYHQWDERQRTKEQVEARRKQDRQRQAEYRAKKAEEERHAVSHDVSHAVTDSVSHGVTPTVTNSVSHGVSHSALAKPSQALTPPTPPNGKVEQDNPPHRHEANALRALTALQADRSLPLTVNELLVHAYRLGHGDPWEGYLAVKVATNFQLDTARNPVLALRARLEAAI